MGAQLRDRALGKGQPQRSLGLGRTQTLQNLSSKGSSSLPLCPLTISLLSVPSIDSTQMETRRQRSPDKKVERHSLLLKKEQKKAEKMDREGQRVRNCQEVTNTDYSPLSGVSSSLSQLRNICGHMHTKPWRKGHDEQDLAATARIIFFFVEGIEINMRELNYKTEDNS